MIVVSRKALAHSLPVELTLKKKNRISLSHERMIEKLTVQTWVFGRHFLKNEQSQSLSSRKKTDNIYY